MSRNFLQFCFGLGFLLILTGCGVDPLIDSESLYLSGNYQAAVKIIDDKCPLENNSKSLRPNLYRASGNLMLADFRQCLDDLARAEDGLTEQDDTINWGGNYLGRNYDGLMLQTYRGLVYLLLCQPADARVAFNRLELRQGEADRRNQRAIEEAQQEVKDERSNSKNKGALSYLDAANGNADNQEKIDKYQHLLDQWGAYADYESPIGRFLSGLFRIFYLEDPNDAEKAVFQLKRTYGMTESEVARQLYEMADGIASGRISKETLGDYVVVLFENGMGPVKEEVRYEIVIPISAPVYVGIALPVLVQREAAYPYLVLKDGYRRIGETSSLCSVDRLVASEFRKEQPWIIAKEITSAVIKVALQVIAAEVARQKLGELGAIGVGLVGSAISYMTTSADVRGWNLLPKEYQVALVPRPQSGILGIATPYEGGSFIEVNLPPGPSLVYVKIPGTNLPALVNVIGPAVIP